jgi:hypothetical protein
MPRKPLTLRSASILAAAVTTGSAAGALADTVAAQLGAAHSGAGHLASAVITLWVVEKLHNLIEDDRTLS